MNASWRDGDTMSLSANKSEREAVCVYAEMECSNDQINERQYADEGPGEVPLLFSLYQSRAVNQQAAGISHPSCQHRDHPEPSKPYHSRGVTGLGRAPGCFSSASTTYQPWRIGLVAGARGFSAAISL